MVLASIFGFISGIALGSFFHIDIWTYAALFVFLVIVFVYRFFTEEQYKSSLTFVLVVLVGVLLGLGRVTLSNLYETSVLMQYANEKVEIEGIIVGEPDVRETSAKLTVKVLKVNGESLEKSEKVLITVPVYPEFLYGDRIKTSVTLKEPELIESEDGREFDYKNYLRVRGIWYTSSFARLEKLSEKEGNPIKFYLFALKKKFTESLQAALPEPESSLLGGLLLGSKQSLGKDILEEFRRTGTSHIVVLSGYNIAIVAENIMNVLKFLPKNIAFGGGVVGIFLFTILAGAGASGLRAAIMVTVALVAKHFNREYKGSRILGLTIILMLAPNPLLLVFDPSFQLSVLATIGIVFVSPLLLPYFSKVPEKFGLREVVSSTIATQITVLPLLIWSTGIVSLVSLPVNVLILGTIPLTMLLGFFIGVFGFISLYLSFIPALFTYALLWYQLTVVRLGSSISFGAVKLPSFSFLVVLFVYVFIFVSLWRLKNRIS